MEMILHVNCVTVIVFVTTCNAQYRRRFRDPEAEWFSKGKSARDHARWVRERKNERVARNIILFIGDGMGMSTVTAARIRDGQKRGESGEENFLTFEKFPHVALAKTYSLSDTVTDSAASGTSLLTGVKTNNNVLGCDGRVERKSCTTHYENPDTRLKSILHRFMDVGRSTGIVTNSRITHATPASAYAQTPYRFWEGDADFYNDDWVHPCIDHVDDIAKQLVRKNSNITVLMGGGRSYFLDNRTPDPGLGYIGRDQRRDGLNLVEEWKQDKVKKRSRAQYVWNKRQFQRVDAASTDYLLGLFSTSHMTYTPEAEDRYEPNLVEMTEKALQILKKDKQGFFLLVEGARIDHHHHKNEGFKAIRETLEFDKAVDTAVKMTDPDETLIIVTADHSHTFTIQGRADKGHDIFGKSKFDDNEGYPYTILGYTNGPENEQLDLEGINTADPDFRQYGCIPLDAETHAGEDVPVYAKGPCAHLFHATHEQTYVYHVMAYAANLNKGP